jgi:hypothetical protein
MSTITVEIRDRLFSDVAVARVARRSGDRRCWELSGDAHVLHQPWAVWPVRGHGSMRAPGARERDGREVWGQLPRLVVAGPGSVTGRHPIGNTGRARVRARRPMPIGDDRADVVRAAGR